MNKYLSVLMFCVLLATQIGLAGSKNRGPEYKNIQMERLNRGLIAVHLGNGNVAVSWRFFESDKRSKKFWLYRRSYATGKQSDRLIPLSDKPIKDATYFIDKGVDTTRNNEYVLLDSKNGKKGYGYVLTPEKAAYPYIRIPLTPIKDSPLRTYLPGDASVGDLDGDGSYEIVIKRQVGNLTTNKLGLSGGTIRLEAYKLDGTRLWQVNLGKNIREGASYFSFMVYDFDGDGKAEIICKTAEGTVFGNGIAIEDTDGDGITDYVTRDSTSKYFGKIVKGPEFISVIDGVTGAELDRKAYISRGLLTQWGDETGEKVDDMLSAVAYLDGKHPSYVAVRGASGRIVVQAWDFKNQSLIPRWTFDTNANNFKNISWTNQGNSNLRVADVDGDGKDELIYGACAIDDTGEGLYSTGWGSGKAMQIGVMDPLTTNLEVWQCHNYAPNDKAVTLRDAASGKLLLKFASKTSIQQSLCADIDPNYWGMELWAPGLGGVFNCSGKRISGFTPTANMALWWDGDLSRELLDKFYIDKWTGDGLTRLFDGRGKGLAWCNTTHSTPCLVADLLGDWREEVIWPSEDGSEIRIYITNFPTKTRIPCLMQDAVYRLSVAGQNAGDNMPTQTGYYLGNPKPTFTESLLRSMER